MNQPSKIGLLAGRIAGGIILFLSVTSTWACLWLCR